MRGDGVQVAFRRRPDNRRFVAILCDNAKIVHRPGKHRYTILDIETVLDGHINVDGFRLRLKLVVKLYCKIPKNMTGKIDKSRSLEALRNNKPILIGWPA